MSNHEVPDAAARADALHDSPLLQAWARFPWVLQLARRGAAGSEAAFAAFDAWMDRVEADPRLVAPAREMVADWCVQCRGVGLMADVGLLSADGFGPEFQRRLLYKVLPEDVEPTHLRDWLRCLFRRDDVAGWWAQLPTDRWLRLLRALGVFGQDETILRRWRGEWAEALRVISARIASTGVDPLVARVYPDVQRSSSPFLAQQEALADYLAAWQCGWESGTGLPDDDDAPLQVLLDQCVAVIQKIRRNAGRTGVTVRLTYRLQRLEDTIARLRELLALCDPDAGVDERHARQADFLRQQIAASGEEASIAPLLRKGTQLAAREVISHAGRAGEHYTAATHSQWWDILRSASVGGVLIALMAIVKIQIVLLHAPPLLEGALVALNYGLGFVLIHLLGGTVATKQPAMTAARIAATMGDPTVRSAKAARESLVELAITVIRGQWTAVMGNVGIALPLAALIAWGVMTEFGYPIADEHKSQLLLDQLDPLGGTLFFAAIAGVCLFLSGVISGYCDNICVFHHLPRRIAHMPLLVRLFGRPRAARIGAYVEQHFGALCGNFLFGLMLGSVSLFGYLSGLPLDIRHIAFSSANLGVAGATLWDSLAAPAIWWALFGVALIGLVNLMVSFALSLLLALRAQRRSWRLLPEAGAAVAGYLLRHPLEPFRLPRRENGNALAADEPGVDAQQGAANGTPAAKEPKGG